MLVQHVVSVQRLGPLMTIAATTRALLLTFMETNSERLCGLTIEEVANASHISERTARRHIKALRALRLIETGRPCRGLPYSYTVLPLAYTILGN